MVKAKVDIIFKEGHVKVEVKIKEGRDFVKEGMYALVLKTSEIKSAF